MASSRITNHSQSVGGGWRLAETEGNLSLLLYHGSKMGRPNMSPWGSGDPKTESELLPLSSTPLGVLTSPLPEELPPRPFAGFFEEDAINSKQKIQEQEREEEEKEEEKEGEEFRVFSFLSSSSLASWKYGKRLNNGESTEWLSH